MRKRPFKQIELHAIMLAKAYETRLIYTDCIDRHKNNTKQKWKNVNHLRNKESKSTNISSLQTDDQIVESLSMSNLFNEYFIDTGQTLSNQISGTNVSFERYMKSSSKKEFNFSDIHVQEILYEISRLNASKSVGPDDIPAKLFKYVVAPFLTLIFNASLKSGIFRFFRKRRAEPENRQQFANYHRTITE